MPKIKPTKIFIAAVCALAIALTAWYFLKPKQEAPQFITAEVSRGDIENAVLALIQNPTIEGFTVDGVDIDFAPDLSTITTTQTIFRKIIIYNLKLKEND